MVEFLCKVYRSFVNVISVITLIIMTIVGFVVFGKIFGWGEFDSEMAVLGAVVGFGVCFIFELLTIPPLMILFSIDSKLEKLIKENVTNNEDVNNSTFTNVDKVKEGFEFIEFDRKKLAKVKDSSVDNYYCPFCFAQVNPQKNTCFHCGKEFTVNDD